MSDKIDGYLEVGLNEQQEIVINIPPTKQRREQHKVNCAYRASPEELCNCGIEYEHIVFSPNQARHLAESLYRHAAYADREIRKKREEEERKSAEAIPVDRSNRTLANGSPVTADHREVDPATGLQKDYVVLSAEERAKGFVRPVRLTYKHLKCGTVTKMAETIAETYARDPGFYSGTFCCWCRTHFPVGAEGEFVWEDGSNQKVGT